MVIGLKLTNYLFLHVLVSIVLHTDKCTTSAKRLQKALNSLTWGLAKTYDS